MGIGKVLLTASHNQRRFRVTDPEKEGLNNNSKGEIKSTYPRDSNSRPVCKNNIFYTVLQTTWGWSFDSKGPTTANARCWDKEVRDRGIRRLRCSAERKGRGERA